MGRQNVQAQEPRHVENECLRLDNKGNYGNYKDDNDNDVFYILGHLWYFELPLCNVHRSFGVFQAWQVKTIPSVFFSMFVWWLMCLGKMRKSITGKYVNVVPAPETRSCLNRKP